MMALLPRSSRLRSFIFIYFTVSSFVMIWLILNFGSSCFEEEKKSLENLKQNLQQREKESRYILNLPTIYAITPTHTRYVQKAELIRLSQTFLHVPKFHWIVVEDSSKKTDLVANLLQESGLNYTHLNIKTTDEYKLRGNEPNWLKPRGVDQRNVGIDWLMNNTAFRGFTAVVYFADDDNTYSLKLFEEMRHTKTVSVWPVALSGGLRFERPKVNPQGKVTGWFTVWEPQRPFAMDMAGFAINMELFREHPKARFDIRSKRGFVESSLLKSLGVTLDDLEPKAEMCTKVYVWHTRTEKPNMKQQQKLDAKGISYGMDVEI